MEAKAQRAQERDGMKDIIAVIFGLGLMGNALLFVPQALALWRKKTDEGVSLVTFGGFSLLQIVSIVHGLYQHDPALTLGMAASLMTCGTVTALTVYYRVKRLQGQGR
jgi:MtN3 and saliva related transmembrane protein